MSTNSTLTVSNSIIRGVDTSGTTTSPAGNGAPTTTLRNSNSPPLIAPNGDGVMVQTDNQNADPKFVDAAAGHYHLASTSPSIDVANPTFTSSTTDRDGAGRSQDGDGNGTATPDQGAYERAGVAPPPDPGNQPPDPGQQSPDSGQPPSDPAPAGQPGGSGQPGVPSASPLPPLQPAKTCTVPSLKALTLAKAERALKKAGCKLGKVTKPKTKVKKGAKKPTLVVRKQGTKAGRKVALGTRVTLTLAVKTPAKKKG